MHTYYSIDKDEACVRTSRTEYMGQTFEPETLKTKGDVLRFLNKIDSLIGKQS